MRIWDIDPGYLSRQSLLGEHRELHGIVSIIVNRKRGYARHPETRRWVGRGWALAQRHRLIAAEMSLRGYTDKSPVHTRGAKGKWPAVFVDEPCRQYLLLREKYRNRDGGRIPLPRTAQQIWSQHKYSVLARDANLYRELGRRVAAMKPDRDFSELANLLVDALRKPPPAGGLRNALQHMWGHVSRPTADSPPRAGRDPASWSPARLLAEIRRRNLIQPDPYLSVSTALGELQAWLPRA